jgi:transcriptional regulator with XRE-family HTH domain
MDQDEKELRRIVGRRLRVARKVAELTQDQLATAAGTSRSLVAMIENGTANVSVYRLRRMAAIVGTTLAALIDEPAQNGRP